jgi:hypothetical protein
MHKENRKYGGGWCPELNLHERLCLHEKKELRIIQNKE